MRKIILTATLALALLFIATLNIHAAERGTYIDCIHGCSELFVCNKCCNETFSSILANCNSWHKRCEERCF
ncbi:hypothetical protein [Desulfonatronum sp. SC1]|uniref:hypothetical protein n=1 Tax=Desulfonatronum sp. SC1 TaxID=2109626 RepID=UPI000D312C64|nr:hypothetical protein [Desulfonatronum sp. SC1]PTN38258.1 hypothetical protein C6366_03320 [Desulfonatronum sp. SC1]